MKYCNKCKKEVRDRHEHCSKCEASEEHFELINVGGGEGDVACSKCGYVLYVGISIVD